MIMNKYISFAIVVLTFIGATSCSSPSDKKYSPYISEQANAVNDSIKMAFTTFDFPIGLVPVLMANHQIDELIEAGVEADNFFEEFEEKLKDDDFDDYGLFVLVTENPRLIQVRLGSYYDVYASLCGVTMGQKYLEIQQSYADGNQESAMREMLTMICDNIRQRQSLSWYQKSQLSGIHSSINSAMEWLGTPSENLFGTLVTKPVYYIISIGSNLFGSWLWGIIVVFLFVIGVRLLIGIILQKLIPSIRWRNLVSRIIGGCFSLIFSLSAAGCSMLFSSGRLEDLTAIKAFGIPNVESFIANPSMFVQETSFILAGAFFFLTALAMIITNDVFSWAFTPNIIQQRQWASVGEYSKAWTEGLYSAQVKEGDPTPYLTLLRAHSKRVSIQVGGLATAALFFFPQAVLWTGIAYSLTKIISKFKSYGDVISVRKANSLLVKPSVLALLIESLGGVLMGTVFALALAWFIDPFDKRSDSENVAIENNVPIIKRVTVTAKIANLRTGPGKKFQKVTKNADGTGDFLQVKRGDMLDVIEEVNGWYKIRVDNERSDVYIKRTLCKDMY